MGILLSSSTSSGEDVGLGRGFSASPLNCSLEALNLRSSSPSILIQHKIEEVTSPILKATPSSSSGTPMGFAPLRKSMPSKPPMIEPKPFEKMTDKELWDHIEKITKALEIDVVDDKQVTHRFKEISCPSPTQVRSIHANYMNKKMEDGSSDVSYREKNLNHLKTAINFDEERSFIASQAPICLAQFDETTFKYWETIFDHSATIIDLTHSEEIVHPSKSKIQHVSHYYPINDEPLNYTSDTGETLKIVLVHSELLEYGHFYRYQVTIGGTTKELTRYHFSKWEDKQAVDPKMLKEILAHIENLKDLPFVHCRAGVGRTGSVITAYYLKSKIEKGEINRENLNEYVYNLLLDLRMQRNKHFVQKLEQFQLVMSYARQLLEEKLSNQSN